MSNGTIGPDGRRPGGPSRATRQLELTKYVLDNCTVTVPELVERFGVSTMTAHRHLAELEDQGVVHRFRGGASAQPSGVFESNVLYRMSVMRKEKAALARHAKSLIEPGMSLLLGDGTTMLALADLLADRAPLTVTTERVRPRHHRRRRHAGAARRSLEQLRRVRARAIGL